LLSPDLTFTKNNLQICIVDPVLVLLLPAQR
jgi:hypothetical protein